MDNKEQVIIVGCEHSNTLGLIRSFGEAGIKPNLVIESNPAESYCSRSKYVGKIFYFENYDDLDKILLKEFPDGGVIVTMSDLTAEHIDRAYEKLSSKFIIPNFGGKGGLFKTSISKETQRKMAEKCGIRTPESWVVTWDKDNKTIPEDVIYPCIIKAIDSVDGPKDTNVFNNSDELASGLSTLADKSVGKTFQIQHFLKKEKEVLIMGYANGPSDICLAGVLEKGLEYPDGFGWYLFGKIGPDIESYISPEKLKTLIGAFEYCGLFGIDLLIVNGNPYMCEINFRNDLNGYYPTVGGVNLPYLWYQSVLGHGTDNSNLRVRREYSIFREAISWVWAREQKQKMKFVRKFFQSDICESWNRKDPRPFCFILKQFIAHHI